MLKPTAVPTLLLPNCLQDNREEEMMGTNVVNYSIDLSIPSCEQTLDLNTSIFNFPPLSYTSSRVTSNEERSMTFEYTNNNIPSSLLASTSTPMMNASDETSLSNENILFTPSTHKKRINVSGVKIKARKRLFNVKPRSVLLTPVAKSIYTSARKVLRVYYKTKVNLER